LGLGIAMESFASKATNLLVGVVSVLKRLREDSILPTVQKLVFI
jgi:hypothetical protein